MSRLPLPFNSRTGLGAVLIASALAVALIAPREALTGWLAAFLFASCFALGGLLFVMLVDIIPGSWRVMIRPPAEILASGMPVLTLLVLPVLFGMGRIFPWYGGEALSGFRAAYLSPMALVLRLVIVFGVLLFIGARLGERPRRGVAIGGLILFVLLHGPLSTDLVLSLDPEFHSSGFSLYVLAIQALTGFAAIILLRVDGSLEGEEEAAMLGALLLTLLLLWAYFDFMQYFILWSGNLPARADWFNRRTMGLWHGLVVVLVAVRLGPAFLLLFPPIRSSRIWLRLMSWVTIGGTLGEVAWLVLPELGNTARWALPSYLMGSAGAALLLFNPGAGVAPEPAPVPEERKP